MKTIDLLVQALPAIGGWPKKVTHIGQDYDRELIFYGRGNVRSGIFLDQLAADHRKHGKSGTKITREQYEAALAAKDDGWIEWGGGECPVPRGTLVDVRYLCGDVNRHIKAGEPDSSGSIDTAFAVRWSKLGAEYDIIAYRLHNTNEAEKVRASAWSAYAGITEADDESDLNECIGQATWPLWNGEGLAPPVGCVCERSWAGDEWLSCRILFASDQIVVIKLEESGIEDAYNIGDVTFRPIRPEAERRRDDICDKIYGAMTNAKRKDNRSDMAEEIYDAIAAGKIPGLRLED